MAEIQVDLVAVERSLWSGTAQMVVARTVDGDIGIMAGHSPLLAQLKEGHAAQIVQDGDRTLGVAVHGGFLSVTSEGVTILAEDAQLSDEIDQAQARSEYDDAVARYEAGKSSGEDLDELQHVVLRAQAQLRATGEDI